MEGDDIRIPDDAPIMVAWRAYEKSPRFALAAGFAPTPARVGQIWDAFLAGWKSTGTPVLQEK